jgi:hypothetical protein
MDLLRTAATIACLTLSYAASAAELPDAIAVTGERVVLQVHAVGAQIYECRNTGGQLKWEFREPIASLLRDGKTVGLHYAGPKWEIGDSLVHAKVSASAPSPSGKDIPWLKLDVTTTPDEGPLLDVTTVQRINTAGGVLEGACAKAGALQPEPYAADYVFLRKQP